MMKRSKKYWNNLAGYLTREMNNEQIEKFLLETKDNQHFKSDYNLMKKSWNSFNSNPADKYRDTMPAWEKLNGKIEAEGMNPGDVPEVKVRSMNYFVRLAAVIVLILAVGIPAVYYSLSNTSAGNMVKHEAADGIITVDMPDGSRVFLNEGATLQYKKDYDEERNVVLEGEGFFEVMEDPERPFMVNAGKVVVTVLGTSFNIRENTGEIVEVFVETGKVQVAMQDAGEPVVLSPGEMAAAGEELTSGTIDDENYLSWKTKEFKFVDRPLAEILEVLETAYHVEVQTEGAVADDMRLTTSYSNQSLDAILNTICTALNMNFKKEGKVYILQSN